MIQFMIYRNTFTFAYRMILLSPMQGAQTIPSRIAKDIAIWGCGLETPPTNTTGKILVNSRETFLVQNQINQLVYQKSPRPRVPLNSKDYETVFSGNVSWGLNFQNFLEYSGHNTFLTCTLYIQTCTF